MGQPSDLIIEMNMLDLARYALICQSEGLVPIVEPDVSLKGDHTLEQAVAINTKIQVRVNTIKMQANVPCLSAPEPANRTGQLRRTLSQYKRLCFPHRLFVD
jgi:fructose-bisphosphate aldolase class 1